MRGIGLFCVLGKAVTADHNLLLTEVSSASSSQAASLLLL